MRYIATFFTALAGMLSCGAQSIDSVLAVIERNNIELKAARAEMEALGYDIKMENSLEAPSVEYSPFFRKGATGVASSELIVSQEFDFPSLYTSRRKSGKLQQNVLNSSLMESRRGLLLSAKEKCLEIVLLDRRNNVLKEREKVAGELLRLYNIKSDQGDATALELNRVKMECMDVAVAIAENQSAMARVKQELNALNGNETLDFGHLIYPEIPSALMASDDVSALMANDASIQSAQASVASAKQDVKVSRQGWLPKISLGYRRNTELDEASNGFLVGVSVPIFSNGNKVKAANARLVASELNMESALVQAQNEFASALTELRELHKVMDVYDINLMNQTLTLLKRSVELGNMSVIDYYSETDKVYAKINDYYELEYRCQLLAASLLKNKL